MTWHMTGVEPQCGEYRYTVKEKDDGTPWIVGEPAGVPLKIVGNTGEDLQVGFDLKPGTTLEEGRRIAKFMNKWIARVALF